MCARSAHNPCGVNFFYLDKNPAKCAQYYCDKHVLKIRKIDHQPKL